MTRIYLAMDDELLVIRQHSRDITVEQHLAGRRPQCLAVDPGRPDRVYCGTFDAGVWRSDDAGGSWQPAAPRQAPGRLYAAAGDGYFESHDGGASWQRPDAGLQHHYCWGVAVDPADPETIVISAAYGPRQAHDFSTAESAIYRRTGDGPWSQVRAGLPEPRGTTRSVLAANAAEPGVAYAANNHGLFRSATAGESWERLEIAWPERYHRQCVQVLAVVAG